MALPAQTGLLVEMLGLVKALLMATVRVAGELVHDPEVTVKVYVPAFEAEALGMLGFCWVLVKPFGPVQA